MAGTGLGKFVAGGLLLLAPALLLAATSDPGAPGADRRPAARAGLADRDGDRLADALQARLAGLPPEAPVAVVVSFAGSGGAAAAQRSVGPFHLKRQFRLIPAFAAAMSAGQARALARAPGILRIEEDFPVAIALDAASRDFGVEQARSALAANGSGVGICVVDTGVDPGHEQLAGKVAGFTDFINGRSTPYDDHGHGTHVSSIAAGRGGVAGSAAARFQGVAPGATIYAAKVLDALGQGTESDVIAGIEWCSDPARGSGGPGVQVISMSLGSESASDGGDALSRAADAAVAAGKHTVVAAGNAGDGAASIGSPGAAAGVVTVGAAAEWSAPATAPNHSDGIYLAPFSSRGPTLDGRLKPDILAPGVSITAAQAGSSSGYVTWSGTSMATPFVAGTLALALQHDRTLSPATAKGLLAASALDRGAVGPDNDWGAGLLDAFGFVSAVRGSVSPPLALPRHHLQGGSIPDNGEGLFTFEVGADGLGVPLAVTLTITDGSPVCLYGVPLWCDLLGGWAWAPDLDAELRGPDGRGGEAVLAESICPLSGDCGTMGRQETLHLTPRYPGTYTVRVYPFADDADGGRGGNVLLDISTGPATASTPANTPPQAADDSFDLLAGARLDVAAPGVLGNDSDPDGDALAAELVTEPSHAADFALHGDGSFTYTPRAGFSGSDSFTYRPDDGSALGNPAFVTLAVVTPLTAEALTAGRYETSGKGRGKTTLFIESTRFAAGDEVTFRARIENGAGMPVAGVTVELTVSGPEALILQSAASDASGIAEARWQTAAPALKGKRTTGTGTTKGAYTATVTALTGGGAPWDKAAASIGFAIE